MAIQVNGTEVISNSRALNNIASLDATTSATLASALGGGVTVSVNAPSNPSDGDLWYGSGSLDGFLRIYTEGAWSVVAWVGDGTSSSGGHLFVGSNTIQSLGGGDKTFTWTVPFGVVQFSAVVISASAYGYSTSGWALAGGGLAYKNNISCSAGDEFTITIAEPGAGNRSSGETGTRLFKSGVVDLHAKAGSNTSGATSVPGSRTVSGSDGGGTGGLGGTLGFQNGSPNNRYAGGGAGGAAGYSGSGGNGASVPTNATYSGSAGSGGGGGGGGNTYNTETANGYFSNPAGGGTSPYGQGTNGVGGSGDTDANAEAANYNSQGVLINGSMDGAPTQAELDVVAFGAGKPSGNWAPANTTPISRSTNAGCCRIVWGLSNNAAFPSTNVAYRHGYNINEIKESYSS